MFYSCLGSPTNVKNGGTSAHNCSNEVDMSFANWPMLLKPQKGLGEARRAAGQAPMALALREVITWPAAFTSGPPENPENMTTSVRT